MLRGALLFVVILAGSAWAQNESASVGGTVMDSSGAAIARAAVRVVNTDTGEAYRALSNESGNYDFPLLKPGPYSLTVELTGFKQFLQNGLVLETTVPLRLDVRLDVGALTQKVTGGPATALRPPGNSP